MKQLLTSADLRKTCDPADLTKNNIATFQLANIIIGQERATKALKFGINIKASGFNIYAAGLAGTGKLTAVKRFVEESSVNAPTPSDWCYVNNFSDNYEPKRLSFPKGKSGIFRKEMKDLIQDILQTLIKAFESEEYADRRNEILEEFKDAQAAALERINERAAQESFTIKQTPWEIIAIPMIEGEAVTDEQFNNLPIDQQDLLKRKQDAFLAEIKEKLSGLRKQEKAANSELNKLEKEVAVHTISTLIEEISQRYKQLPEVSAYIKDVQNDILDNLPEFLLSQKGTPGVPVKQADSFLKRYEVNVLVDNSNLKGAPVVIEHNPTYNNLLGRVEKESYMGTLVTDFTMIRKGSLHSANGGYLILRVEELLRNYLSWDGLKRALKNKEIVIEDATEQLGLLTTRTLKPQPVPLDVKVILIGHPMHYQLLYEFEPEFKSLFKVKADFDSEMQRNDKSISDYVNFTKLTCSKEKLLMPDAGALAKMVEYGSRLVSDQQKLSTRFDVIADVIREANHYAMEEALPNLFAKHISKAIEEKAYRSGLIREKIHEMITTGQIFIDITGSKTGQLNGLAVLDLGDILIGRPNRISCSISLGKEGVVAIEREAELSGPIHTKGVMILTGYLTEKYLRQIPASLTARLVFEQSYSEIEGDSASSTELYAILSNLSGLPIRQGIAVTGSVNQKGEIQAIGGVNEKIEGYFEVCKQIGLNGEQGVLIPAANKRHLMLKEEVVTAVEQKKFFIWTIETVDEGIEILTGVNAGAIETEGSVAFLVNKSLQQYASKMKEFLAEEGKNKSEK